MTIIKSEKSRFYRVLFEYQTILVYFDTQTILSFNKIYIFK